MNLLYHLIRKKTQTEQSPSKMPVQAQLNRQVVDTVYVVLELFKTYLA